jgi:hypothetical protein
MLGCHRICLPSLVTLAQIPGVSTITSRRVPRLILGSGGFKIFVMRNWQQPFRPATDAAPLLLSGLLGGMGVPSLLVLSQNGTIGHYYSFGLQMNLLGSFTKFNYLIHKDTK